MNDWEENPEIYLKDAEGNFLLKKDGTPKSRRRPNSGWECVPNKNQGCPLDGQANRKKNIL